MVAGSKAGDFRVLQVNLLGLSWCNAARATDQAGDDKQAKGALASPRILAHEHRIGKKISAVCDALEQKEAGSGITAPLARVAGERGIQSSPVQQGNSPRRSGGKKDSQ